MSFSTFASLIYTLSLTGTTFVYTSSQDRNLGKRLVIMEHQSGFTDSEGNKQFSVHCFPHKLRPLQRLTENEQLQRAGIGHQIGHFLCDIIFTLEIESNNYF